MTKESLELVVDDTTARPAGLRNYPAPWKGQIVLACRKCRKKLKRDGKKNGVARLRKELKKRTRRNEDAQQLRVIEVSCLKLCPKGGVTVCTQRQLGDNQCCIVRSNADIDALVELSLHSAT